jgi:ubiquinone/menaquinone biosynthesis C-methylase UbiE
MKLWQTRKHWELFARTDALGAILTNRTREKGGWNEAEFFATGRAEVGALLARAARHRPESARVGALDFGCGVGRLTQALGDHFQRVTGVDIAEGMLERARGFNRHGERVRYLHNTRPDLRLIPDAGVDLVLSMITLQHLAPEDARRYIAEFARVTRPGGLILFQVPAGQPPRRKPMNPATPLRRIRRWWRRCFPSSPTMEMHALPVAEVRSLLEASGARVFEVSRIEAVVDFEDYLYLAEKLA